MEPLKWQSAVSIRGNFLIYQSNWSGPGPYNYQKALYTGKHFYLPKSTEKTQARLGLRNTIFCVLNNKDVYRWQE